MEDADDFTSLDGDEVDVHAPASLSNFVEGAEDGDGGGDSPSAEPPSDSFDAAASAPSSNPIDAIPAAPTASPDALSSSTSAGDSTSAAASSSPTSSATTATAAAMSMGASSRDAIAGDADLSEADKNRVQRFTSSLEDGLIGMDDILLGGGEEGAVAGDGSGANGGEMLDRGDGAEEYSEEELAADADADAEADGEEGGADNATEKSPITPNNNASRPSSNANANKPNRRQQQQQQQHHDEEEGLPFDISTLLIRRLPREIAPRALCDCSMETSPNPSLMRTILNHIPSAAKAVDTASKLQVDKRTNTILIPAAPDAGAAALVDEEGGIRRIWRWMSLETIYKSLSVIEKRELRPYRGLANFIRLHGRLCEVSEDSRYVIAHDPTTVPPLIPTLRFFSVEDRLALPLDYDTTTTSAEALLDDHPDGKLFDRAVGSAQVPTTRLALQIMDPKNPLLDSDVLYEEIANFLPDHPVYFKSMTRRLPPLLKAAVPSHIFRSIQRSRHITVMQKNSSFYVMKSSLGEVVNADVSSNVSTLEETLAAVKAAINLHGSSKVHIWMRLSFGPRNYIKRNYENIGGFFAAFPKVFYLENHVIEMRREHAKDSVKRMRQLVHLVSNMEAREKDRDSQAAADARNPIVQLAH